MPVGPGQPVALKKAKVLGFPAWLQGHGLVAGDTDTGEHSLPRDFVHSFPSCAPKGTLTRARARSRAVTRPCLSSTESQNLPKQPPLMLALGQATECLRLMARAGLGSCSFARVDDYLH